jgi:ATP-binding protein involved in chromosome partitioning
VLGVVENMSYFLCPHCGGRTDVFGHGGAASEAARLGVPFLGAVPLHGAIRQTSDAGTPVVVSDPEGEHAVIYRNIAAATWERVQAERGAGGRRPPRIVVED